MLQLPISIIVQVELRDIPMCPVTGLDFMQSENDTLGTKFQMGAFSELSHIIPFSLHNKVSSGSFSLGMVVLPAPADPITYSHRGVHWGGPESGRYCRFYQYTRKCRTSAI
jgi:hypothetical protein